MNAGLEAIGLKMRFPVGKGRWLHALDGVGFNLAPREALGVVGESGSGKSTLARVVARLVDQTDGAIVFDGADIGAVPVARFGRDPARRAIQLVFQSADDALNPAFTAARNIATGLGAGVRDDRRVAQVAAEVGLPAEHIGKRPHQLSGGQQARVGIARALIADPRLLILDEPTASLDVSVQAAVLKLIDALRRSRDVALLFISHDLDVVRLMCERIMVLYLGRVAEIGPVDAVLGAPRHPYTRALVAARPGPGRRPLALAGEAQSAIDPPDAACLFHTRCPLAVHRCRTERPLLRDIAGRTVACHRADDTTPAPQAISEPAGYSPR